MRLCGCEGLHTNSALMQEIVKCKTSIAKKMPGAPHEILLVLDGTTGLNMLNQVCVRSSLPTSLPALTLTLALTRTSQPRNPNPDPNLATSQPRNLATLTLTSQP